MNPEEFIVSSEIIRRVTIEFPRAIKGPMFDALEEGGWTVRRCVPKITDLEVNTETQMVIAEKPV